MKKFTKYCKVFSIVALESQFGFLHQFNLTKELKMRDDDFDLPNYPTLGAISVKDFCRRYDMSRSKFYLLAPKDRPRSFLAGRRRLIRLSDVIRWEEQMIARNDNLEHPEQETSRPPESDPKTK